MKLIYQISLCLNLLMLTSCASNNANLEKPGVTQLAPTGKYQDPAQTYDEPAFIDGNGGGAEIPM